MACSPRVLNSLLLFIVVVLGFYHDSVHSLNIGIRADESINKLNKNCSTTCESMFCDAPPYLRYGKYCGVLYSGCPGEEPCDQLDTCCMRHDKCIDDMGNDYFSLKCNTELLLCVDEFSKSGAPSFQGNTCNLTDIYRVIDQTIKAAIIAAKIIGKQ